ncbi:MAG: DUF2807 domain-containing protein [Asticcacaulis sp.]
MRDSIKAGVLVAGVAMLTAAGAQAASGVELKNVAARVIVTPEDRSDVKVTVSYGKADLPKVMVSERGGSLLVSGQLNKRELNCNGAQNIRIKGKSIAVSDLPVITLRVPRDAKINSEGATFGRVSAARSLSFGLGGCGDWTIDTVDNKAELSLGGSGTLRAGNLGDAEIAVGGSGDVYTGKVRKLSGAIGGSGSINVAEVSGPVELAIGGSGDVRIEKGYAPKLEVSIAGAGDVRFAGEAGDVEISIVGSGDVSIRKASGHVSRTVMGSGNIRIGQ